MRDLNELNKELLDNIVTELEQTKRVNKFIETILLIKNKSFDIDPKQCLLFNGEYSDQLKTSNLSQICFTKYFENKIQQLLVEISKTIPTYSTIQYPYLSKQYNKIY